MKPHLLALYLSLTCLTLHAQNTHRIDHWRSSHQVPGLAYAIVSADSVLDIQYLGLRQLGRSTPIDAASRFRTGSNTKAVTVTIAAMLVQRGSITWDTRFFDLLLELRDSSDPAFASMTLRQLLEFKVPFPRWSYPDTVPTRASLHAATAAEERTALVRYFLRQAVLSDRPGVYRSNISYVAAGLMLERAAHRSYAGLVQELNEKLHTDFATGEPNATDSLQTWGHDYELKPQPPYDNYKLNWLLPAGNINTTLSGYVRFIQSRLYRKDSVNMSADAGMENMGWFIQPDGALFNIGNPGTYYSQVYITPARHYAIIILMNAQTDGAIKAMGLIHPYLRKKIPADPYPVQQADEKYKR